MLTIAELFTFLHMSLACVSVFFFSLLLIKISRAYYHIKTDVFKSC